MNTSKAIVFGKKTQLRRKARLLNANLSSAQRKQAAHQVRYFVSDVVVKASVLKIAIYWPLKNEFDSRPLTDFLQASGAQIYLPAVIDSDQMEFRLFTGSVPASQDWRGLACPSASSQVITRDQFDLMILPLWGFDALGNRLGTGGGYYDRYLEGKIFGALPHLIGLSFDEQRFDLIPTTDLDVRMDAVITPSGFLGFSDNLDRYGVLQTCSKFFKKT